MIRCKCNFPTFDEARRLNPHMPEEVHARSHRVHHDEWDARRTLDPERDHGKIIASQSVAVEHELRLARLEAAVCSLGVDLPVLGPVDAAVRSVAAGRLSAKDGA